MDALIGLPWFMPEKSNKPARSSDRPRNKARKTKMLGGRKKQVQECEDEISTFSSSVDRREQNPFSDEAESITDRFLLDSTVQPTLVPHSHSLSVLMADQKESPSCNFQKHVPVGEAIQLSSGPAIAMGAWNSGVSILDSDICRCIGKVTGNKNESVAQKV